MSDTPVPPSKGSSTRNVALLTVGLGLATQIPTTLAAIPDPTVRALVTLAAAIAILWIGVRIR